MCDPSPPGLWYAATDSSFKQGRISLSFMKIFKEYIVNSGLNDGKSNALLIDRHASHVVTIDVLNYVRVNNINLFNLSSHSSSITQQPLDIGAFEISKHQLIRNLNIFSRTHAMPMPVKSGIGCIVLDLWETVFTPANNLTLWGGAASSQLKRRGL